jgi:hypothetical protein
MGRKVKGRKGPIPYRAGAIASGHRRFERFGEKSHSKGSTETSPFVNRFWLEPKLERERADLVISKKTKTRWRTPAGLSLTAIKNGLRIGALPLQPLQIVTLVFGRRANSRSGLEDAVVPPAFNFGMPIRVS